MVISDILTKETIDLHLNADSKTAAVEQMASLLSEQGYVSDAGQFINDVLKREESSSTGIGFGVAIPHGKSAGVVKPALSFAKFAQPIEWQSLDEQPVTMLS